MKLTLFPARALLIFAIALFASAQTPSPSPTPSPKTTPRLVVQLGNLGGVGLVALSPNGQLALTAEENTVSSQDFSVCLWEVQTGREIRRFSNHTAGIRALTFSRDSRSAASAGNDKTARVWNVETGEEVRRFDHPLEVLTVAFSPDGNNLLTTTSSDLFDKGGLGYLWDLATGKTIHTLEGHGRGIPAAAYANNGNLIATGSWDKTVRIWSPDGKLLHELKEPHAPVVSIAFSPDSTLIAVGNSDQVVQIFEADTARELKKINTPSSPRSVSISPDNRYVLSGSKYPDTKVHLWEIKTGTEARSFSGTHRATLSADGKLAFVSSTNDPGAPATLWSTETGELVRRFQGYATGVIEAEISSDSNYLVTLAGDGSCHLWNLQSGTVQSINEGFAENAGRSFIINSTIFTPDGKSLLTAERDDILSHQGGGIQMWDAETGNRTKRINAGGTGTIAISGDGKLVMAGKGEILGSDTTDHAARWYWLDSGKADRKFEAHTSTVKKVALSQDGRFLLTMVSLSGSEVNDPARLWDLKSGRELYRLAPQNSSDMRADAIALSPDGSLAATAHHNAQNEAVVLLWDTVTGKETLTLKADSGLTGFAAQFNSLAFALDGQTLATSSNDRTIRLWSTTTGQELKRFEGHADGVNSVKFAADKRHLISASDDATVRLWSLEAGREVCRLISFNDDPVEGERWVVVTPDGRFDTNNLNKIQGLHWILSDAPLSPQPLEIYMRDYYEPQLLSRLLRCEAEKNCATEFKPLRDLATLNRVLPEVKITKVTPATEPRVVNVTIEVGKTAATIQQGGGQSARATGVYDLRLFRDNQLVGYSPANDAKAGSNNASTSSDEELQQWRTATEIRLSPDGKQTFTFAVPLPNFQDSYRDLDLAAYAYNADRVKSETVRWAKAQKQAAALKEAPTQRRAYIISVGVNTSYEPQWQLKYAANDAREFQRVVTAHLNQTSQSDVDESIYTDESLRRFARQAFYYDIVPVPLIADDEVRNGQTIEVRDATKAKIHAVLDILAGKPIGEEIRKLLPNGAQLRKATPDDLVLISFSCHGYADRNGGFYLLPYDIRAGKDNLPDWQTAVSSDELSLWLRDVDAGDMALIIDACHAAAFTGAGFKPGPMGSRGLGQLAFDKGMLVLAATQASEAAIETGGVIQQGLLSYALVHDGLESGLADYKPKNNQLTLKEWLRYAVGRVPQLNREAQNGKLKAVNAFAITQGKRYQQPSLFDFTPRRTDVFLSKRPAK
ncbi:MAG: (Myosin heavy-chain) kinase [Acidobacteria bacterium]|nr:(Myosin heavy-chain) kinase [Acidobacteriota bacterium]